MVNKDEYRIYKGKPLFLFSFSVFHVPENGKHFPYSFSILNSRKMKIEKPNVVIFCFFFFSVFLETKKCKTFSFFQLKFSIFRKMEHVLHFPETENIFPHTTPTSYLDRQLLISVFHANFMAL